MIPLIFAIEAVDALGIRIFAEGYEIFIADV